MMAKPQTPVHKLLGGYTDSMRVSHIGLPNPLKNSSKKLTSARTRITTFKLGRARPLALDIEACRLLREGLVTRWRFISTPTAAGAP